jgi:PAS domain S-box-containing protein
VKGQWVSMALDLLTRLILLTAVLVTAAAIVFAVHQQRQLRESEKRFPLLAESAPVLIWVSGIDKGCTYFNPGWLEMTGRRLEDELGNGWTYGVHPDDLSSCMATYVKAFDARRQFTMEYRLRRHDGEYRWVLDTGVPRYGADRHFVGYVGSCIDITDRRRVEERLREVGGRLVSAQEEERRRVARELHDDLSQQLALLGSELEQLSLHHAEDREEMSDRLIALGRRAQSISSDVYRLSHQLHPTKLEALGLVPSLRSYCREVSMQQSIHVSFTHADVPSSIPMDVSLCVYRIVQEALRNVAKHSGANEAHVQILTRDGGLCLRIADAGTGFDPDAIGHVGLGLISIRERLRFVGGDLQVHTARSHGTRLDVWIPIALAGRAVAAS